MADTETERAQPEAPTPATGDAILEARELIKDYDTGKTRVRALDGVTLGVARGRFLSIMGPSGSGKSTLLHLLGGLDKPTSGEVFLEDRMLNTMTDKELTLLRRHRIGFVFQFFNLVPVLSVEENISLPAVIDGHKPKDYRTRLEQVIELVGLGEWRTHLPSEISGGQQQRVAVARALFMEPAVLLADEPTGNLDSKTSTEILELIKDAQRRLGQTVVVVTHDARAAAYGDEIVLLRDGKIADRLDIDTKVALSAARRGKAAPAPGGDERAQAVLSWLQAAGA